MTIRVALIRHGAYHQLANTPSAWQPFALTEQGKQETLAQAEQFVDWLLTHGFKPALTVFSSPLLRAWQTADIYIDVLRTHFPCESSQDYQHKETGALSERCVGSVANLSTRDIENLLELDPRYEPAPLNWKSDTHYRLPFPGAESLSDAGNRVAGFIDNQCQQAWQSQSGQCVNLVIGHGAAIRHAACHLNVIQICDVVRLSMFHAHPIIIQHNAGQWQHIAGNWKLRENGQEAKD